MFTYEDEMDRKYGISGKLDCIHLWEIEGVVNKMGEERLVAESDRIIQTGFRDLDEKTGGFNRGETYILASRPGMGKNAFALSLISNFVNEDKERILYCTPSTGRKENLVRLWDTLVEEQEKAVMEHLKKIAMENLETFMPENSNKESYDEEIIKNHLDFLEAHSKAVVMASDKLAQYGEKLFIDDRYPMGVQDISIDCAKMNKVDLVIIDSLQVVSGEYDDYPIKAYEREKLICEDLKYMAEEYNCPVLILSNLPRIIGLRDNPKPKIDDAYELLPGNVIDNVMFLYRDEYYNPDTEKKCLAEVFFVKRRGHGDKPIYIKFGWDSEKRKIYELEDARGLNVQNNVH